MFWFKNVLFYQPNSQMEHLLCNCWTLLFTNFCKGRGWHHFFGPFLFSLMASFTVFLSKGKITEEEQREELHNSFCPIALGSFLPELSCVKLASLNMWKLSICHYCDHLKKSSVQFLTLLLLF